MRTLLLIALLIPVPMQAQTARGTNPLTADVERLSAELNPRVVAWRRDFHQNPELGNRETRTAKIIADELRQLGFTVTTGVATTGVVGVLRGGLPGPVVALRSDTDAGLRPARRTAASNNRQVAVARSEGVQ